MKKFLIALFLILLTAPVYAQDTIADLTARGTLEATDLFECEDVTPAGSFKCTLNEIFTYICTQGTDTTATCALNTDSVSANELNAAGVQAELEAVLVLSNLQGAVTDAQVPNTITIDEAANVIDADFGDISVSTGTWNVDNNAITSSHIAANTITEADVEGGGALGAGQDAYVWSFNYNGGAPFMEFVSNAAGAETDPTLTDDAAVTLCANGGVDCVLTFDSSTGNGTITWDDSAQEFDFNAPITTPPTSQAALSLTDSDNTNTDVSVKYGSDQQDVDNADAVISVEDGGVMTEKLRIKDESEAVALAIDVSLCTGGANGGKLTVSGTDVVCADDTGGSGVAFSGITGSTNTTAAMVVGTGASLSATGSGSITATAAAADTIDAITEIAASLKSGSDLTLMTGTAGTNGNCAEFDVNGDIVDSGGVCGGGAGAPTTVNYLVGTADATLSNEIEVGTAPGGELGGTWASPTIDDSLAVTGWTLTTPTISGALQLDTGVSPTVNTSGQVIIDTTGPQLLWYYGAGGPWAIPKTVFDSVTVEDPATESVLLFKAPYPLVIEGVDCVSVGGTSSDIDIQECDANGGTCVDIDTTPITCGLTNTADDGTISDPDIDAGDYVRLNIGTVTGSVTQLNVTVEYRPARQ